MAKDKPGQISTHVAQVLFVPNATFLDRRGAAAIQISEHMKMPSWEIDENRIKVFREGDPGNEFSVSFKDFHYRCVDPDTPSQFPEIASRFVKFLGEREIVPEPLSVIRVGVRSRTLIEFDGSFE